MKSRAALILSVLAMAAVPVASAQNFNRLGANLTGFEETPLTLSTPGNGRFDALISGDETQIEWQLSYADTESPVTQAHIHLGQRAITGGITVFFCTNLGNGPVGTQPCPPAPATITGTITAADVSSVPAAAGAVAQGIGPGEFAELLRAIRAGATYVNVHTTGRPGGEIRDQIGAGSSHSH
jgi:CHRD domain